jgi:hypothetical protein
MLCWITIYWNLTTSTEKNGPFVDVEPLSKSKINERKKIWIEIKKKHTTRTKSTK